LRDLNESHYHFTAPEGAPPCEVYNFSVTATYVGATYTGAGCSLPLETLMLYSRNPLDTNRFWMKVDLLGELILNITMEVSTGSILVITIIILLAGNLYSSDLYTGASR
jgi:hypothetical protein